MKPFASLTGRLSLTLAITTSTVILVAGLSIVAFQLKELRDHQIFDLKARAELSKSVIWHTTSPESAHISKALLRSFSQMDKGLRFRIDSPEDAYRFPNPKRKTDPTLPAGGRITRIDDELSRLNAAGVEFLITRRVVEARGERPEVVLTVGLDTGQAQALYLALGLGVLFISAIGAVIATLISRTVIIRGLRPVGGLSASAAELDPTDLSLRLPENGLPEELTGLASAFNGALSRLEEAYERLSAFNADVAHELRTPLANMIGQTQVALARERGTAELKDALQSNLEELERLKRIVNDMLFLARADDGAVAETLKRQDLAGIVLKAVDFMEPVAEEFGATISVEGDVVADIEPSLLERAVTNLLDNAMHHGDRGGNVRVEIGRLAGAPIITVINSGEPIPESQLRSMFNRFHRLEPSRTGRGPNQQGHGLGLAIVQAIAAMHHGHVLSSCRGREISVGIVLNARNTGLAPGKAPAPNPGPNGAAPPASPPGAGGQPPAPGRGAVLAKIMRQKFRSILSRTLLASKVAAIDTPSSPPSMLP